MATSDQVKYKLPPRYQALGVVGGGLLALVGIISIAAIHAQAPLGVPLFFSPAILGGAAVAFGAVTTTVTIHEQGVVIRQKLRRRFIPWQAVLYVGGARNPGERTWIVWLDVDTGVKYMDKHEQVDATRGTEQHVKAIVEEMEDLRRRERAARLSTLGP